MSGHSKWASIKHKKGAADQKRGKIFSKFVREISVAARFGGGDPASNPRLRTVIAKAKQFNMPADNIDKAIKKGTGELPGVSYEEITYEGYGPAGVALMVDCLSDNKNRTSSEIRNIFDKRNGRMAGAGSVAWNFNKKGFIAVEKEGVDEDQLLAVALDAGAEDFNAEEKGAYEIFTRPEALEEVNFLLRDYRANLVKEIDPNLLDLLFHLNQKLETEKPFHVISGYRSPKTNAALRKRNRRVARNSLHMAGMAVDLRVPDVHVKHLCNAALDMHCGGVGYYARRGFVHVDVGNVRVWQDGRKRKKKAARKA